MRSRAWLFAAASIAAVTIAGCSGGTATPASLAISPSNPGTVYGPTLFSAVLVNDDATITWSLTGPGALSGTTGVSVTYSPPPLGAAGSATLTATSSDGLHASVTVTISGPELAAASLPGLTAAVQVSYDAQDIPHVTCAAVNDCLEAQGYLQARDRLFQMDLFRRTARGTLATLIGSLETGSDKQFLTFFTTRDGKKIEDELVANLDSDTAGKLGAFVAGINEYITELKHNPSLPLPGEYNQLPYPLTAQDIPAWTAQDTLAIGRLQQFQLSETISEETNYGMFAAVYAQGPLADASKMATWMRAQETQRSYTLPNVNASRSAQPMRQTAGMLASYGPMLASVRDAMGEAKGLLGKLGIDTGSNNWAVDAAHSATGQAMVANDPHLSLQYPPLFHLIAMTGPTSSGLDMQGGAFPGIPGALIGRGAHVGWGDTVVGYDVTDLYLEDVEFCPTSVSPSGLCTMFNGAPLPLLQVNVTVNPRGSAAVPFAVYVNPKHGPMLQVDPANHRGISMRWTGHEVTNDIRAFLNLNVATRIGGVADVTGTENTAFKALHDMATGAQNFMLADDQGNIGYDPHALVPKRPWAGSNGRYPWLPLPGDGSAEWGSQNPADNCAGTFTDGNGNPTPTLVPSANCWYADADLPHADASNNVPNGTGFLATANSDPAGYGDNNIPISVRNQAAFYLSFDWDDPTGFRHKRISDLLAAYTASGKVSVADMQAIQTDHASSLAAAFLPTIDAINGQLGTHAPPAYAAGAAMMHAWGAAGFDCPTGLTGSSPASAASTDATVLANSGSCMLFHVFLRMLLNNVFDDDLAVAKLSLDSSYAIRGMLYMLQPTNLQFGTDQTFCNNVDSSGNTVGGTTTCVTQVVTALATAYGTLAGLKGAPSNWLWGRVHTLTLTSPASPIIDGTFGAGAYARPGGALTVDVGNPSFSSADPLAFSYGSGSNLRMVAEMNPTTPNTKMQLPGPERDGPVGIFSSSPDLIGQYVQNQYFDFAFSTQIEQSVVSTQTFNPQGAQ